MNYLIGVDGGGTGTRVVVADANGIELARGNGGPSGLLHGSDAAWNSIMNAIQAAFKSINIERPALSQMAIGLGLAGVHNRQWAAHFAEKNPGFAVVVLETDAYTTLLGAHSGKAGAIVAIGTGSVGEALLADGTRLEVGGWGFPCGDEAGGAWLGLRAMNHAQQMLDGRCPASEFSRAVVAFCGGDGRDGVFAWLAGANQTAYAQLAPLVIAHAKNDPVAVQIMQEAGREIAKIAVALDSSETLPIALCGGLAQLMQDYLPGNLARRIVQANADSASGALLLIKNK